MNKLRFMLTGKVLSILAMTLFILPINVITAFTQERATTKIQHRPLEYYVSGNRIQVEAKVEDATGVKVVRCYFRASGQSDYVFAPLQEKEKGLYQGILPAPADQTGSMEYLFLVVNGQNRVIKSQIFSVNKKEQKDAPSWQMVAKGGSIPVSSEISQTADIAGYYSDNVTLTNADPSFRYGYAAALYEVSKMVLAGNAAGSAASASSGGTVIAETGGISTGWYVALGLIGAAVVGVAAGGGGGGGSSGGSGGGGGGGGGSGSRFMNNGNGTVTDTQTGLMWADRDNGSDINWPNARTYCEGYNRGGVSGWRMPTISELQGLYNAGAYGREIGKTNSCVWSSETRDSEAAYFYFLVGEPAWSYQSGGSGCGRALPVRSGR